jgi:hypothetical protein
MVRDLFSIELSAIRIVGLTSFSKNGVEWFHESAIKKKIGYGGCNDKFHSF